MKYRMSKLEIALSYIFVGIIVILVGFNYFLYIGIFYSAFNFLRFIVQSIIGNNEKIKPTLSKDEKDLVVAKTDKAHKKLEKKEKKEATKKAKAALKDPVFQMALYDKLINGAENNVVPFTPHKIEEEKKGTEKLKSSEVIALNDAVSKKVVNMFPNAKWGYVNDDSTNLFAQNDPVPLVIFQDGKCIDATVRKCDNGLTLTLSVTQAECEEFNLQSPPPIPKTFNTHTWYDDEYEWMTKETQNHLSEKHDNFIIPSNKLPTNKKQLEDLCNYLIVNIGYAGAKITDQGIMVDISDL